MSKIKSQKERGQDQDEDSNAKLALAQMPAEVGRLKKNEFKSFFLALHPTAKAYFFLCIEIILRHLHVVSRVAYVQLFGGSSTRFCGQLACLLGDR